MKCAKCGAELKVGCIYCSVCGQEAQIVPDYNLFDDVLTDALTDNSKQRKKENGRKKAAHKQKHTNQKTKKTQNTKKAKNRQVLMICGAVCVGVILCVCVVFHVNSYEYQFKKGEQYLLEKEYAKAFVCFKKCIEKEPEQSESYLKAAEALENSGDTVQTLAYLEDLLEIDSENADAYEKIIDIYEETSSYDKIIQLRDNASEEIQKSVFGNYYIAAPGFEEPEGIYEDDMTIYLWAGSGFDIYYTTDGSSPVENGIAYDEKSGIELTEGTTTIQAVCLDGRGIFSDIATATYEIAYTAPDMPVVAPDNGTYTQPQPITILVPDGCTAYYTWDRSVPTRNSTQYSGPIEMLPGNNVLSVVLIDEHGLSSAIFRGNYVYMP